MKTTPQITSGNNNGALIRINSDFPDTLDAWATAYFRFEVTTAPSSQKVQTRDLKLFLTFMSQEEASLARERWSPRLSKAFVDFLRNELRSDGARRWGDKTINRILAHLKTFSKWIHKLRPFPLGNPMAKIPSLPVGTGLEIDRALTESERRRLLDAGDQLPIVGGRSRDRRRHKNGERPQRRAYRPWRNRAIIYCLIETGMRRGAVSRLNLADIDLKKRSISVQEKGGLIHNYKISRQGLDAIEDYINKERDQDVKKRQSPALFLPARGVPAGKGRLSPRSISNIWTEVCALATVSGKSPHAARHAMGKHIIQKTGNIAAVQRQLGHKNAIYSMQYSRISDKELADVLDER